MKLLTVIDEMSPVFGGAAERTYQMARYLGLAGVTVDILTTKWCLDKEWIEQLPTGKGHYLNAIHFRYLVPFGAQRWLKENIRNYDLVHVAKNWSLLSSMTGTAAMENNIPYIFSAMGFVAIHNRSRLLKRFYKRYMTTPLIKNASATIAVTDEERIDLINGGALEKNVCLIPNGIVPENFLHRDDGHFRKQFRLGEKKIMLFIGRMDPIKGVHLLIDAFERQRNKLHDWVLVLAGTHTSYRKEMEQKVVGMGLSNSVIFIDPIFGEAKSEAYHAAEFIVIPSVKDAMTIIAPEAACCAKPVLLTRTADFGELARRGGAVEVAPTIEGIEGGIELLTNNDFDRVGMGAKGFEYVAETFRWENIAVKYLDLFNSVVVSRATRTPSTV